MLIIARARGHKGAGESRPLVTIVHDHSGAACSARERWVQVEWVGIELRELGVLGRSRKRRDHDQCTPKGRTPNGPFLHARYHRGHLASAKYTKQFLLRLPNLLQ